MKWGVMSTETRCSSSAEGGCQDLKQRKQNVPQNNTILLIDSSDLIPTSDLPFMVLVPKENSYWKRT